MKPTESPHLNREWLYQKHVIEKMSPYKIGKIVGRHSKTIRETIERYNIPRKIYKRERKNYPVNQAYVTCLACSKVFPVNKQRYLNNKSNRFFCTRKCKDSLNGEKSRIRDDRRCPNCLTQFYPKRDDMNYCSRKCSAEWRNKKVTAVFCCECCGELFERKKYKIRDGYKYITCSKKCHGKILNGISSKLKWQGGEKARSKRRYQDINYRIRVRFSQGIHERIKRKCGDNSKGFFRHLPYTVDDLILHLESRFTDGMNWDNYGRGGWHIDHIYPVSSFKIKRIGDKEFLKCYALENLQPLWEKENLQKSNRNPIEHIIHSIINLN